MLKRSLFSAVCAATVCLICCFILSVSVSAGLISFRNPDMLAAVAAFAGAVAAAFTGAVKNGRLTNVLTGEGLYLFILLIAGSLLSAKSKFSLSMLLVETAACVLAVSAAAVAARIKNR